jgi:membrane peptidoglycan carboxypeptidase
VQEKQSSAADWFIDQAALSAADILGVSYGQVISGGYRIMTTMDPALQNAFDIVIQDDNYLPPDAPDGTRAQCAAIAMEKNGAVRACIGGRNYEMQLGLNRATDAKRQPGSVLKPLAVYAPAFEENRITTATFLSDEPTDFKRLYAKQLTAAQS